MQAADPTFPAKVLAGQAVQEVEPVVAAKVPVGQGPQEEALLMALKVPMGHNVGEPDADWQKEPGVEVQATAVQEAAPGALVVPAGQGVQAADPRLPAKVLAAHAVQEVEPTVAA